MSDIPLRRFARVIELNPEKEAEYRKLHAEIWPEISTAMAECHLENSSIHLTRLPDDRCLLFSYFEYAGENMDADMKRLAESPRAEEWAAQCEACQLPLENRPAGQWWSSLEEVFYLA